MKRGRSRLVRRELPLSSIEKFRLEQRGVWSRIDVEGIPCDASWCTAHAVVRPGPHCGDARGPYIGIHWCRAVLAIARRARWKNGRRS